MSGYIASNEQERQKMLATVGVRNEDELFAVVPADLRVKNLKLPSAKSQLEVSQAFNAMADKNTVFTSIYRGAGAYNHYVPPIVNSVVSKDRFLSAYTPYQAELSQGILQAIFEYQTMICKLTGMDVSNASVYDGATAAAEAINMCNTRSRRKTLVVDTAHYMDKTTIKTYCHAGDTELVIIPAKDGLCDLEKLEELLDNTVASVYVQSPNFYGLLEDCKAIAQLSHAVGAKLIVNMNPVALALYEEPASLGADIAVGEGQPLGMPLSFGGPYLGFIACSKALTRMLPGRIVGETNDKEGRRAFVLTLQAREQHIRREKASSNICSNQALCAMTAAVYLATMGNNGLVDVAKQCYSKAHYASEQLSGIEACSLKYGDKAFFHEFVLKIPATKGKTASQLNKYLSQHKILSGLALDDEHILWCFTELCTKDDIDYLTKLVAEFLSDEYDVNTAMAQEKLV